MVLKKWMNRRKENKESLKRIERLTEEELQELEDFEKKAYLTIAKRQVTYRGKINAYKDFPIEETEKQETEKQEIDMKNNFVNELNKETSEQDSVPGIQEDQKINNEEPNHAYQAIRQV